MLEELTGIKNKAEICREYWLRPQVFSRWREEFLFTRGIRGWHLGRNLDHTLTLVALQRGLVKYPAPEIHHSDQGVQYAATAYTQVLQDAQAQISLADQGEAWQNGYAERLIRAVYGEGRRRPRFAT